MFDKVDRGVRLKCRLSRDAIKNYDHLSISLMRLLQWQFRGNFVLCGEPLLRNDDNEEARAFRKRGRKRVAKGGAITVAGHRTLAMQADCVTVID